MHLVLSASSINLFLATNMEFYAQGWIFFFYRKSKPVVLPDVVATLSSEENILESPGGPSQDKIILEKLEEENLRLKAIFKLHSIKIQEDAGGGDGGGDGGDGGEPSRSDQARRRSSSGSARVSSISSESSSASVQSGKVEIS